MARRKKPKKMTIEELGSAITSQKSNSIPDSSSKLSNTQAALMNAYMGAPYGDEIADRSNVVTREVMETVEWMMPQLIRIFQGGDEVVKFVPQGPEDIAEAEQATDYVNYVYNEQNQGFKITYQWLKDGLMQKNGIVKVRWEDEVNERENYEYLDAEEVELLLSDSDVEVTGEIEEHIGSNGQLIGFSLGILRTLDKGKTVVENVPGEEFHISKDAKDIQSAPYVAHTPLVSISDLNAMGFKTEDLPSGTDDSGVSNVLLNARYNNDDTGGDQLDVSVAADDTMKMVRLEESYIRVDFDNDGIAELRQVFSVGGQILEYKDKKKNGKYANKEVNWIPLAGWTPIIMSHKWSGLAAAELVTDIQRINSQLFRNMLDNQYVAVHGKYAVIDGMVNMDDMQTGRPHGIVRTKMAGAIQRIDVPQLNQTAFSMLELTQQMAEKRTGVSARTQGLDENQLNPNTAATAVNQVMTAAQQRIELIARVFGETGFTDLFNIIYATENKFQSKEQVIELRNEYVAVDPSSWRERKNVKVTVGLGNGSKDSQMFQLNTVFQQQMQLNGAGKGSLVSDMDIYNTVNDMAKLYNPSSNNRYYTDPKSPEAQQAKQEEQQAQQKQEEMMQMQMQLAQAQLQLEEFKVQAKAEDDAKNTDIKQQSQDLDVDKLQAEIAFNSAELALEAEQERPVGIGD